MLAGLSGVQIITTFIIDSIVAYARNGEERREGKGKGKRVSEE